MVSTRSFGRAAGSGDERDVIGCSGRILPSTMADRAEAGRLNHAICMLGRVDTRRDRPERHLNQRAGIGHGPVQLADAYLEAAAVRG